MRINWNKVISGLAAVAIAGAVVGFAWNLTGMTVAIGLKGRIAAARAQWVAKSGGNYRAVVRVIDYNHPAIESITVIVKDGKLVEASARSTTSATTSGDTPLPPEEASADTIEALFDYAAAQVADVPDVYLATGNDYRYVLRIDPELSYVAEFKMDVCGRGPLAVKATDCRWGFDVLDVQRGG